ncbi:MAG: hypothetical protein R3Y50_01060 [Rikenellaceae bacterium]
MKKILLSIFAIVALASTKVEASQYIKIDSTKVVTEKIEKIQPLAEEQKKQKKQKELFQRVPKDKDLDNLQDRARFAYKGEILGGVSLSYVTASSQNSEVLLVLNGIDASGTLLTVKPFVGYFYKDNRAVGVRFGYSNLNADLDSADFDFGSTNDLTIAIPSVNALSESYSYGIFHRSYTSLDRKGRVGLFAEVELSTSMGKSTFGYEYDGVEKHINSKNNRVSLDFNPGAAVYVMPNFCVTLSFGLGGVQYNKIEQTDDLGEVVGNRQSSNMSFKFNVADINVGMVLHLWTKNR